jgi:autotransporter-associated beta strand protein
LIRGTTLGVGGVINGNITLTGGGGLTKTDNGTWTIGAAGKTYSAPIINVSAGILKMGADNYLAPSTILSLGNTFNNVGNFDLNGFSQTVGGITNIGTGVGQTITSSAGTPVLTVDNPSAYSPANLILTGSLGLAKTGNGALTLSGTNTYTGTTTVASGTLAVNGNISTSSLTTVNSGATIQGSGTVGQLTVNGTLAPGNSIESLGVGNLSFTTGSTYAYELQTDLYAGTPNVAGDLTYSSGTLNIASGTILTLTDLATSTALTEGSKLTLLSSLGAWNGGLFSYDAGAGLITLADDSDITLGANIWRFNYNDTSAGSNFTADTTGAINYVTMTVIPEPRAALLGGLGMLALLRRRRN